MIRAFAAFAVLLVVGPLMGLLVIVLSLGGIVKVLSNPLNPEPSDFAVADIPAPLLAAYRQAGTTCPGLPWTVLAGIGKVESNHGRFGGAQLQPSGELVPHILGPLLDGSTPGTQPVPLPAGGSPWHTNPTWDRALGMMQFLTGTFRAYGVDADGDGVASPHDAFDAIATAARYLCGSDGEVADVHDAIYKYNRSDVYVNEVLSFASRYGRAPIYAGADPQALLANPNVTMGAPQRADLEAGRIDPQLVAILLSLAQEHRIYISMLITGHTLCVAGTGSYPNCTLSRHPAGLAADIAVFDGARVNDANQAARAQVVTWLGMDRQTDYLRPWSVGHPFGDLAGKVPGDFNDADHEDHIHIEVTGTFAGA